MMIIEQMTINIESKAMDIIFEKLDSLGYEKNSSGIEKFLVDFSNDENFDDNEHESNHETISQKAMKWTQEHPDQAMAIKNTFLNILSKVMKK